MKKVFLLGAVLLFASMASVVCAQPNIFGMSGLITTPDDQIIGVSEVAITGNYIDFDNDSAWTAGGAVGLFQNFEASAVVADTGDDTEFLLNAKYRLVGETATWPGVTIGIADAFGKLYDDPSWFIVFGKELASTLDSFGTVSGRPLRGTVGLGTKIYDGVFAGLSWAASEKFDVMVEYVNGGFEDDSAFNAGVQYKFGNGFAVKAGLYDMSDVYVGVNMYMRTF